VTGDCHGQVGSTQRAVWAEHRGLSLGQVASELGQPMTEQSE